MSARKVVYHPDAPSEARAFYEHYSEISDELSEAFWNELLTTIDVAREFPERHHFDATGLRRANLKRFPVHFLFRVFPEKIRITTARILRMAQGEGSPVLESGFRSALLWDCSWPSNLQAERRRLDRQQALESPTAPVGSPDPLNPLACRWHSCCE